ncbi:MAG: hypothetical protein AAF718_06405 [Pseudomonadota bacterium]
MALKVLSGVLVLTDTVSGTATVNFTRHQLSGDVSASRSQRHSVGPDGPYNGDPAYLAVPREITIVESADFKDHPGAEDHGLFDRIDDPTEKERFVINSTVSEDQLEIRWRVTSTGDPRNKSVSQSHIPEISYMVVGET